MDEPDSTLQTADRVGFDTLAEKPLSAADAAKLHRRLTGRSVSIRTLYRWMSKGRNGVVLQHVKMAGQKYTSAEALNRFFNRSAAVSVQSPQASRPKKKQTKTFFKTPTQGSAPEGKTNYFCSACMKAFAVDSGEEPEACPEGHRNDDPELNAPSGITAEEAEVTA